MINSHEINGKDYEQTFLIHKLITTYLIPLAYNMIDWITLVESELESLNSPEICYTTIKAFPSTSDSPIPSFQDYENLSKYARDELLDKVLLNEMTIKCTEALNGDEQQGEGRKAGRQEGVEQSDSSILLKTYPSHAPRFSQPPFSPVDSPPFVLSSPPPPTPQPPCS